MDVLSWLKRRFKVSYRKKSGEANFNCPKCGHDRFYFSVKKGVGYCQRASCHWNPSLKDLQRHLNSHEDLDLETSLEETSLPKEPVRLPEDAVALLDRSFEAGLIPHCNHCKDAITKISSDRKLCLEKIYNYRLYATENRIYIPVYDKGKLVNYVGRLKWWLKHPEGQEPLRYKYAPGVSTSNYIFDWDNAQYYRQLTLVENTFNAIWLRELNVTTNFGSYLSDEQINLISKSKVKSVLLIWDQHSESNAEKSVDKLKNAGVAALYAKILGQPDQHTEECIRRMVSLGHTMAMTGKIKSLNVSHLLDGECKWQTIK